MKGGEKLRATSERLPTTKSTSEKMIANSINFLFNGETLEGFFPKIENKERICPLTNSTQHYSGDLFSAIKLNK